MSDILAELFSGAKDNTSNITDEQRQSDKERCRYSLVEFVKTYLSDSGDELDELCSFHYEIAERLQNIAFDKKKSTKSCIMSPRGHGKSFWTSYAFPLWCIAYQHTKNILIVTNEGSLGKQFIVDIRQFIEDSEKFIADFGNLVGNVIWSSDKIQCSNGICVSSKGSGASLRGVKMFGVRPTVIIGDDILNEENSGTTDQRKKLYNWYTKVLIKCSSKYCHIFIIGTPQNDADLLSMMFNLGQFSDYYTKKYQAVIEYSESELWDEWTKFRDDLSNANRADDADAFYLTNKEEMLRNTSVLWDRYDDTYLVLMKERAELGTDAWSSEMMCEALDENSREFPEEWIQNNLYEISEMPEITDVYIGVDAAATALKTSDDSAICVVGKGINNYFYVLDTFSAKVGIDTLSDQMLIFGAQYNGKIRHIRIEDVVFQLLAVKGNMEQKAISMGMYLPFDGLKVAGFGKKQAKLRSLIIPIRSGHIKFRKDQLRLLGEMRRFPKGKADNNMDALWIATHGIIGSNISSFSFGSISGASSQPKQSKSFLSKFFR